MGAKSSQQQSINSREEWDTFVGHLTAQEHEAVQWVQSMVRGSNGRKVHSHECVWCAHVFLALFVVRFVCVLLGLVHVSPYVKRHRAYTSCAADKEWKNRQAHAHRHT